MSDPTIALTPKTNASNLGSEGKAKLVSAEALVVGGFVDDLIGDGLIGDLVDRSVRGDDLVDQHLIRCRCVGP